MGSKANAWIERFKTHLIGILLTGAVTMGTWIVTSINTQNIHLAELLLEVKSVNERLGQYATKDELRQLEQKLAVHIAVSEARK